MSADFYDKAIEDLYIRRQNILEGRINCIPIPFPRFSNYYYGLERGRYNIFTANQKVGKSKFADNVCMYHPLLYAKEHPDEIQVKILYFTLEMSKKDKLYEYLSHLLMQLDNIRISPKDLKSTSKDKPVSEDILNLLKSDRYQEYIRYFKDNVTFEDQIKHPTGILKRCEAFAKQYGHWKYKEGKVKISSGEYADGTVKDYFEYDDPKLYLIVILDNFSNLELESGLIKRDNIDRMSKYCISLRDEYSLCINVIQHQAQAQEGIENFKLNKLEPSSDGVADCKTTTRDVNAIFGLFNPAKFDIPVYPYNNGYDINRLKNYARFVKILEDRDGGDSGSYVGMFFDGATSTFIELPPLKDTENLEKFYKLAEFLQRDHNTTTDFKQFKTLLNG